MIKLTSITPKGQWHNFSFECSDPEMAYQVLHTIVRSGDTLVNVTWLDAHGCLPLPLDALEKASFSNPLEALRQQWETLLAQPVGSSLLGDVLKQQLSRLREDRLGSIRRAISYTQELIERTHQHLKDGSEKARLLTYYQHALAGYSRSLIRLETASPLN